MKQREIKFRALYEHIDGSRIWHEVYVDASFGWCFGPMSGFKQLSPWVQFTGLKDKNGKDIYDQDLPGGIYEGGRVQWCDQCHGWSIGIAEIPGHCHQCDGNFMWLDFVDDVRSGIVEVIGNIHENPELVTP